MELERRVRSQGSESRIQDKNNQDCLPLNYWLLTTDYFFVVPSV